MSTLKTIPQTAKSIIGSKTAIAESLRNELNNVFIRPAKGLKKWQLGLFTQSDSPDTVKRTLQSKYKPAVSNAIILCYLLGDSGKVRNLFHAQITGDRRDKLVAEYLALIQKRYELQYSEFFCLGIVQENLEPIMESLQCEKWNPLLDKLSSPFFTGNLHPIAWIYGEQIHWSDYHQKYDAALSLYEKGKLTEAKKILHELEAKAVIRLPVVSTLLRQLEFRLSEAESYFEYLQKNL